MKLLPRVALALASALLVAACGAGSGDTAGSELGDTIPEGGGNAVLGLDPLPGETLEGEAFDPETLAGASVVLWFWAPWCTICRAEAPGVASVADELEGEVTFIGVPGLGAEDAMRSFVEDTGTQALTHLPDKDGATWGAYGVLSQPAFVFVTPSGATQAFNGALGEDKLKEAATALTVDSQ